MGQREKIGCFQNDTGSCSAIAVAGMTLWTSIHILMQRDWFQWGSVGPLSKDTLLITIFFVVVVVVGQEVYPFAKRLGAQCSTVSYRHSITAELQYLVICATGRSCPLNSSSPLPLLPGPGNHHFILSRCLTILDTSYEWNCPVSVLLCLANFTN